MKRYVCGVLFSHDLYLTVLMKKKRPKWQADKLNFPGGGMEPKDGVEQNALTREVFEELGVRVPASRWKMFAKLTVPQTDAEIYFGTVRLPQNEIETVQTMTDEPVFLVGVSSVLTQQIAQGWPMPETDRCGLRSVGTPLYNIAWLTSMALSVLRGDDCQYIIGEVRTTPGPFKVEDPACSRCKGTGTVSRDAGRVDHDADGPRATVCRKIDGGCDGTGRA